MTKDDKNDPFRDENYQFPKGRRPAAGRYTVPEEKIEAQKSEGTDTSKMTEDEKRAASRARVEQRRPDHEVERAYWGKDKITRSDADLQTNERFAGGKSWKEIRAEEQKGGGKGRFQR